MAAPQTIIDKEKSVQSDSLLNEAGGIIFENVVLPSLNGSSLSEELSHVTVGSKFGDTINMMPHGLVFKANGDIGMQAGLGFSFVAQHYQYVAGGDYHIYAAGDATTQHGKHNPNQIESAKKLQDLTKQVDTAKLDKMDQTQGDEYPCPTCQMKLVSYKAQHIAERAVKILSKYIFPHAAFAWETIKKYLSMLIAPLLVLTTNFAKTGGKGCGSPGCKNGKVRSVQGKIQAGNQAAADKYNELQSQIQEAQKGLGSGGTHIHSVAGDLHIRAGLTPNDSKNVVYGDHDVTPTGFSNAQGGDGFCVSSEGNAKKSIHSEPLINPGSIMVEASNKLNFVAGSPGIDILTSGKIKKTGSTIELTATDGEAVFASNNKTFIKGKNIHLDGNDRSGDTAIILDSNNIFAKGKLSVSGDICGPGSIMIDGGLHCTHIEAPGERIETTAQGDANTCSGGTLWNHPIKRAATKSSTLDLTLKAACRDLAAVFTGYATTIPFITGLAEELYSKIMIELPLDNHTLPTGLQFQYAFDPVTSLPIHPVPVVVYLGPIPLPGHVIPCYTPIYNFPHIHSQFENSHSHHYTGFKGHYFDNATAAMAARPNPSHVPTTAKYEGTGTKPGHKSMGDSCGGGGGMLGTGNSPRVNQAIAARNAGYGLPADYGNNQNYVPTTTNFNPDGTMNPPPAFNLVC